MQAIGFLSRREHSRQELRVKLLDALRKRAREEADMAAAAEAEAREIAEALSATPSNGIDDAFAPSGEAMGVAASSRMTEEAPGELRRSSRPVRSGRSGRSSGLGQSGRSSPPADVGGAGDLGQARPRGRSHARRADAEPTRPASVLDKLVVAGGGALPARLRSNPVLNEALDGAGALRGTSVHRGDAHSGSGGDDADAGAGADADADADADAVDVDGDVDGDGAVDAFGDADPRANSQNDATNALPTGGGDPAEDARAFERDDPEAAVEQLLDWLTAHGYLSEQRFVESRVNARARKQGTTRIRHELARHGLTLEPEQVATLRETEFARAQSIWQRKFGEVAADPRGRAKQARFLAARGFASDVVRKIVGGEEEF